jgi:hypothetical protein
MLGKPAACSHSTDRAEPSSRHRLLKNPAERSRACPGGRFLSGLNSPFPPHRSASALCSSTRTTIPAKIISQLSPLSSPRLPPNPGLPYHRDSVKQTAPAPNLKPCTLPPSQAASPDGLSCPTVSRTPLSPDPPHPPDTVIFFAPAFFRMIPRRWARAGYHGTRFARRWPKNIELRNGGSSADKARYQRNRHFWARKCRECGLIFRPRQEW